MRSLLNFLSDPRTSACKIAKNALCSNYSLVIEDVRAKGQTPVNEARIMIRGVHLIQRRTECQSRDAYKG